MAFDANGRWVSDISIGGDDYNWGGESANDYSTTASTGDTGTGMFGGLGSYLSGTFGGSSDKGTKAAGGVPGGLGSYLSTGTKILEGAGKIMEANNARKSLALAREKFGFEKAAANRNAVNQGKAYNEELGRRADVGLALGGNAITDAQRASTLDKIAGQKVSEAAIG